MQAKFMHFLIGISDNMDVINVTEVNLTWSVVVFGIFIASII